jgi:hypothetical protein
MPTARAKKVSVESRQRLKDSCKKGSDKREIVCHSHRNNMLLQRFGKQSPIRFF